MGLVEKQLNIQILLSDFLKVPTIENLATLVSEKDKTGVEIKNCLVPIKEQGRLNPLFVIHPSGGSVHWYSELAALMDPEQPVYGLQAKGVMGDAALDETISQMAASYLDEIMAFKPEGPYLLASWSFGVIVVYELAQQLVGAGHEVAFLGMFDQGPLPPFEEPANQAEFLMNLFGKNLPLSVNKLAKMTDQEQIRYVYELAQRKKWLYSEVTLNQFQYFIEIHKTQRKAWRQYKPGPFAGKITVFVAEKSDHIDRSPDLGWDSLAENGVETITVPGDHLTMLQAPHVKKLALAIQKCLISDVVVV
jgi:thioesterase domain-containing protein